MYNKNHSNNQRVIRTSVAIILTAITALSLVIFYLYRTNATGVPSEAKPDSTSNSMFRYDNSQAPGWQQGATNETSMAVFDRTDETSNCFLSSEYYEGELDEAQELGNIKSGIELANGTIQQVGEVELSFSGTPYTLHLLDASNATEQIKEGLAYGFIPHSGGFIKLYSICDQPEQRESTYVALAGVRLNK